VLTLKGKHIYLRALEPTDLDFLYALENDENIWEVSETSTPYSKMILKDYLKNSYKDIYEAKQLRLAICNNANETIGFIDLFDFNPKHSRAGVGIIVKDDTNKNKGIGTEALSLLINYVFTHLNLHQLYANITQDNAASIKLFTKLGFTKVGEKKDWIYTNGTYKNELLYQLINHVHS
jgi:diamine N-acetyltransferase